MATPDIRILAPTRFEWWMLRRLPGSTHAGIGLQRWDGTGDLVIVVGVAGGLIELPPGTIVVPTVAATEDGSHVHCDSSVQEAVAEAARERGYRVERGPLLTARAIVRGADRIIWADRGFVAADMETALIQSARRVGALRIILDSPQHEISAGWLGPLGGFNPLVWRDLPGIALRAPVYMRRLASVLETALGELSCSAVI